MKIWVINGPNINMLGIRETEIYGTINYAELLEMIAEHGRQIDVDITCFQSNHEGDLIDTIQDAYGQADGIVINPGGYTHTSIAIADALKAVGLPTVEVHLSDVFKRENFRQISFVREACIHTITGHGVKGYLEAVDLLKEKMTAHAN